jgi:LacI family transcriptional regulator
VTRLKDVAKAAGVSIRTITRVLNDAPDVNVKTRKQVRRLLASLNYRPHRGARSLKMRTSHSVVFLTPDLDELTAAKAAALERRLREADYSLEMLFCRRGGSAGAREREVVDELEDRRPIAAVLLHPDGALRQAVAKAVPACVVMDAAPDLTHDAIFIDRPQGVYEAVAHLLRGGRTRPAYIGGEGDPGGRLAGYRRALSEWPAPLAPLIFTPAEIGRSFDDQFLFGRAAAKRIAALPEDRRPDALQAYTDVLALGLLNGFHACGIRTPEQIAVIGFDDRDAAAFSTPRLTTVAQPDEEVGRTAAEMILEKIGQTKGKSIRKIPRRIVPTRLVVRDSA